MSRSIWKGPYIDQTILKKNKNVKSQIGERDILSQIFQKYSLAIPASQYPASGYFSRDRLGKIIFPAQGGGKYPPFFYEAKKTWKIEGGPFLYGPSVPFSLEASCTNNLSGRSSIETCQLNTPLQSNLTGATPKGIKSTSRSTAWCSNVIRAPSRNSVITPATQGKKYQVSTGNKWSNILIREEMIGHKFGEFAWTKKIAQYKRKSKIKKKGR